MDPRLPMATATCTRAGETGGKASLPAGATLGRYVVLSPLGEGGMGVVYAAHDFGLDRRVCLKVVRGDPDDHEREARLVEEARAIARLSHPNVVAVYDVGAFLGQPFIAMELVGGPTLSAWLRAEARPRAQILSAFEQAGRGLAAAHRAGLVHRDFKPDNVLVGSDGRVRVTDFGLAMPAARAEGEAGGAESAGPGTPAYMAPEQHRGEPATAASDQYAFCVALFEALAGARPFRGATAKALEQAKLEGRLDASRRLIPSRLRQALARGLSADPRARHPSMEALLQALEPPKVRPAGIGLAAACAIALLMALPRSPAPAPRPPICEVAPQSAPAAPAARPSTKGARILPAPAAPTENAPAAAQVDSPAPPGAAELAGAEAGPAEPPRARIDERRAPPREERVPASPSRRRGGLLVMLAEIEELLEDLGILDEDGFGFGGAGPVYAVASRDPAAARALDLFGRTPSDQPAWWRGTLAFGTGPAATSVAVLERDVTAARDPIALAGAKFRLAQALWETDRQRALELIQEARLSLRFEGPAGDELLGDMTDWLDGRGYGTIPRLEIPP